ncbi:hypothetical protein [Bradyrhizobium sp. 143]|uniref:ATP-dependent DNA ligase n=1 Tax=unclassified Bradyrhizobium TaxID=2631580 RepID=UPI0032081094
MLGVDGVSDFNALHSRKHDREVQLYAFDVLAMDGADLRDLPLHLRKTKLQRLLARRPDGITVAPFERGDIGPDLYRAACRLGPRGACLEAPRSALPRPADRSTGSKSRTAVIPQWGASYNSRRLGTLPPPKPVPSLADLADRIPTG